MTMIRIALDQPGPAGDVRAVGRVRATPTLRRTVGDVVVLPAAFSTALVDGVATVELAATGTDWCWRVEEMTAAQHTRYVAVPDSGSTLGYEDLVDVDPATLDPAAEPTAAWDAALAAAVATLMHSVTVETGTEARPNTTASVVWFDIRADQSLPPTNIGSIDQWVTGSDVTDPTVPTGLASSGITSTSFTVTWNAGTDNVGITGYDVRLNGGAPETVAADPRTKTFADLTASTAYTVGIRSRDAAGNVSAYVDLVVTTGAAAAATYNVFGASAPPGTYTWASDAAPYIVVGQGFRCSATGARAVGGRAWIPAAASGTLPTEATFYLFGPNQGLGTTPVQTKVVSTAGATAGSWVEAMFDTPQTMGSTDIWMIAVRFTGVGDAGKYPFGSGVRATGDAVPSVGTLGADLGWVEYSAGALTSAFQIGTGSVTAAASNDQGRGLDILVDLGA